MQSNLLRSYPNPVLFTPADSPEIVTARRVRLLELLYPCIDVFSAKGQALINQLSICHVCFEELNDAIVNAVRRNAAADRYIILLSSSANCPRRRPCCDLDIPFRKLDTDDSEDESKSARRERKDINASKEKGNDKNWEMRRILTDCSKTSRWLEYSIWLRYSGMARILRYDLGIWKWITNLRDGSKTRKWLRKLRWLKDADMATKLKDAMGMCGRWDIRRTSREITI